MTHHETTSLYHPIRNLQSFIRAFRLSVTCVAVLMAIVTATPASATTGARSVTLSAATVAKGYTATSGTGTFSVALPAGAVADPVRVRLTPFSGALPAPDGMRAASDVWSVDVTALAAAPQPVAIAKPLTLALTVYDRTLAGTRAFFWNARSAQWVPLPSSGSAAGRIVRAKFTLPYAQVALFADDGVVEGVGSWFRDQRPDTAASNDFPVGSALRVTDLETKKTVRVVVRTRGPFVPGRVIDLAKQAFQQLRPARSGVARMRVEQLEG